MIVPQETAWIDSATVSASAKGRLVLRAKRIDCRTRGGAAVGPQNRGGKVGEIEGRDKIEPGGRPGGISGRSLRSARSVFVHSPSEGAANYRGLTKHGVARD